MLFNGKMGSGKTTLIKEICKELAVIDIVSSPTFSLVNEYNTKNRGSLFHFDFYRVKEENEALDIGIEEYLYSDCWCFIEWGEKIKSVLPLETVKITITKVTEKQRAIELINYE